MSSGATEASPPEGSPERSSEASPEGFSQRTFGNEDRLPRVPLPRLEDSCERFLAWCAPLLTAGELAATRSAVQAFLEPDSPARTLQAALERYDADGAHSWLDAFWEHRYLGRRDRLAINANFFFLFQGAPQGQVKRAAELLAAAVDYKLQLDTERVPPAWQRQRPLSMEQHKYLFSAARIPGPVRDTMRAPYSDGEPGPSRERHVVVFVHGHAFRLDVLGRHGEPHTPGELAAGLDAILTAGAAPAPPGTSVGHLTTQARAEWAASRQALLDVDPGNAALLDTIETALLCLCLDDAEPADASQACDHLLHGDSANRWFDKSLSLIVFRDGTAGLNAEHAKLDGTTILAVVDGLLGEPVSQRERRSGAGSQGVPEWAALEFALDAGLRRQVQTAAASFAAYAADTATRALSFDDVGTDRIKQLGMSPDAFVQMAYQLAHQRTRGRVGATYESIATRHYRHGRTEAMRVVTAEVVAFVAAMADPDASASTRRTALRAAAAAHVERAQQCQDGRAPEQHLWELQLVQQRHGAALGADEPLALYQSPGWLTMREDDLSTSSAPSSHIQYFGFGSTSPRCIGIAYVLLPDGLRLYLSTPRGVSEQMTVFAHHLRAAVQELLALLGAGSPDPTEPLS